MTDIARDPFSPECDPYPEKTSSIRITRRVAASTLIVLPILAQVALGCAHVAPACPVMPGEDEVCRQRFCRYARAR